VQSAIDVALRRIGGVPAYLLTDNEKTVTVDHVAGIPVRNPAAVAFGRHYGLTVATCVPYDPASKGGSESTVKIAKADLRMRACCRATGASRSWRQPAWGSASRSTPGRTGSPGASRRRCSARSCRGCTRSRRCRSPRPGGDPPGGHDVAGDIRGRPVLGPAHPGRAAGLGPAARRPGRDHARRAGRPRRGGPPPGDHSGQPAGGRRALPARAAWRAEPRAQSPLRRRSTVPGDRGRRTAVAGRGRRRGHCPGPGEDGADGAARRHARSRRDRRRARPGRRAAGRFADGDLASVVAHQAAAAPGKASRAGEQATLAQGTSGWAARDGQEATR
jgi:hypothetical protein